VDDAQDGGVRHRSVQDSHGLREGRRVCVYVRVWGAGPSGRAAHLRVCRAERLEVWTGEGEGGGVRSHSPYPCACSERPPAPPRARAPLTRACECIWIFRAYTS